VSFSSPRARSPPRITQDRRVLSDRRPRYSSRWSPETGGSTID
jgi:hypothetical protein